MRCWVKSRNERNPCLLLQFLQRLPCQNKEEGGDDVKSSWPLRVGLHTCYNGGDRGQRPREGMLILKSRLSSDRILQLGCVKVESLVIADQHAAVNTFPGLVHTARHTMEASCTGSRCLNPQGTEPPMV